MWFNLVAKPRDLLFAQFLVFKVSFKNDLCGDEGRKVQIRRSWAEFKLCCCSQCGFSQLVFWPICVDMGAILIFTYWGIHPGYSNNMQIEQLAPCDNVDDACCSMVKDHTVVCCATSKKIWARSTSVRINWFSFILVCRITLIYSGWGSALWSLSSYLKIFFKDKSNV